MNKHLASGILFLSLSGLLITSCSKEPSFENPKVNKVKSEQLFDEDNNQESTIEFTYENNKITKADIAGSDHFTFEYNGNTIVRKNYSNGTTITEYDKVNYKPDGSINTIEHYIKDGSADVKESVITLTYSNDKVSKITLSSVDNNTLQEITRMEFTYTDGNITSEKITDVVDVDHPETLTFTYDNKENYIKNLFTQTALIDPALSLFDEGSAPFLFSKNNPVSVSSPLEQRTMSYTLNGDKSLKNVNVDGKIAIQYNY